jgi:hypothetical protein
MTSPGAFGNRGRIEERVVSKMLLPSDERGAVAGFVDGTALGITNTIFRAARFTAQGTDGESPRLTCFGFHAIRLL